MRAFPFLLTPVDMNLPRKREEGPAANQRDIPGRHFRNLIGWHVLVVSIASVLLLGEGASVAHFFGTKPHEALLHVGLGCVLIAAWVYIIVVTIYGVVTALLSKGWLLILPWAAIVLLYLQYCPLGYVGDVSEFIQNLERSRESQNAVLQ